MRATFLFVAGLFAGLALAQERLDTAAWTAMGQGGNVHVHGEAMEFTYQLGTSRFSAAVLPVTSGLEGVGRIRFRAKADHDTAIALSLSEKKPGGGDYTAWFWAPADRWQQIELTPADFILNDGPKDPVDSDGKLDLDQVVGVGLLDVGYFFSMAAKNPNFPIAVARSSGEHTLLVESLQLLSGESARASVGVEDAITIDAFERGFLQWVTLGGMNLRLSETDNPLGVQSMEASYEQSEGPYPILVRRLANLDLAKARRLVFDVASEREATLVVSLELKKPGSSQGPRYNATIFAPEGRKMFHVNVRLSDFEPDANSREASLTKLEPSRLKSLAITDITVASGGEGGANTIWIGNVRAAVK